VRVHRVEKVFERLRERDLAALVVTEPSSRFYLTGWPAHDSQPGETAYWLLIDHDGATIVSSSGNEAEALEAVPDARFVALTGLEPAAARVGKLLKDVGHRRIGYDDDHLSAGDYLRLRDLLPEPVELVPAADLVRSMRAVKEAEEIELLREAIGITDRALDALRDWLKPGVTEREVAWFAERYVREHGAEGLAFPVLVGSGPTAACIHNHPTDRRIREGEPCWIDLGAKVGGYCADLSRGFCLGRPDERTQALHEALIVALDLNIADLQPGANGAEVARRSAAELERRDLPIGHVGGHGIGLQVHEAPYVDRSRSGSVTLVENMVVTADPGVYVPGWGGMRVEDDVLVTANGPIVLSSAARGLTN
jgi:Xaa-Pro aminopeptidase